MNYFLPMLGVGLVTSVHCVAMCGSMVLTYAVKGESKGSLLKRMMPHAGYQIAKIFSYVMVGLLLGSLGAIFDFGGIRGWVTLFAGAFMVLLGLNMTGKFPWLRHLTFRPPKVLVRALSRTRKKAMADEAEGKQSLATPVTFGLLTGFMPCGPLQAAQLAAAGTGAPLAGAISMLGFGLGTAPLMLAFGAVSGILGAKFKDRMMIVAAIIVAVLGLVMVDRGLMLVGSPITAQTLKATIVGAPVAENDGQWVEGPDGVVEIDLTIANVRFDPAAIALPENTPVRLIVDRQEDNVCSDQLAIPQLGILQTLTPYGTTVIDIPASPAGSYTMTCQMGMMAGRIQVGDGTAAGGNTARPILIGALAFAGIAYLLVRQDRRTRQERVARLDRARQHKGGEGAPKGGHTPQPRVAGGVFGFSPPEVAVILAAFSAAVIAGLALGGMLTY